MTIEPGTTMREWPSEHDAFLALHNAVADLILGMDETMKGPSTLERGRRLAALVGKLQDVWEETRTAVDA